MNNLFIHWNRERLDNLVKSASIYKTKACGVLRKTPSREGSRNSLRTPSRVLLFLKY